MNGDNNSVAYNATMDQSRLLGNNFRTARKNKRLLAVALVTAAVVDNYQLEPLIEDSRKAMVYSKLDKPEQRQAQVFFSELRNIVGSWAGLEKETQEAFLNGNLVFSTLSKAITDAKKAAEAAEADDAPETGDATETGDVPAQNLSPAAEAFKAAREALKGDLTEADTAELALLIGAIDAIRAATADKARKAA